MPARVSHLWRHPIKGHGVEAVAAVALARRRHHALGPGLGDRPRGRPGRARRPRLGALRQLQPRRQVARADGDPRPGGRGARARVTLTHPRREPLTVDPRPPRGRRAAHRLGAAARRPRPRRARLRGARRRPRHDRQRLPLGLDPERRQPRARSAERLGQPLAMERFRGNIWLDGLAPWAEFDLVGREIRIGGGAAAGARAHRALQGDHRQPRHRPASTPTRSAASRPAGATRTSASMPR